MTHAVLWLVAGLVLIGAEVVTGTFVLLMLGGGALVARHPGGVGLGRAGRAAAARPGPRRP